MTSQAIIRKFNITVAGEGEPTLVLAHGFGSDQTAWRHQVAALSPRHRVVRFDHLGCGLSDPSDYDPRRYSSVERYAEDILQIYEALDLADTVFVGHSVSAMLGILASLARPSGFARLVFLATSPRYLDAGSYTGGFSQDDLDALYAVMADDYLTWAHGFAPTVMSNSARPELGREFARTLAAMRPSIAQSAARVIFEADLRARLGEITHPVLLLQSLYDPLVPRHIGNYMNAHIPNSQLLFLDAEGHLPHLSAPEEVTAAIRAFAAL